MKSLKYMILLVVLILVILSPACKKRDKQAPKEDSPQEQIYHDDVTPEKPQDIEEPVKTEKSVPRSIKNYEFSWTESDRIPPVLIIIDDFGYIRGELLDGFAALDKEVAFAILPDLPYTELAGKTASASGHEVLIHFPMQALSSNTSPGSRYLKQGMAYDDIEGMLKSFYEQIPMAIAVNNHMGSTATSDADLMEHLMKALKKQKLAWVDSYTSPKSVAFNMAIDMGLRSAKRDVFLDVPDNSEATIISKIEGLGKFKGRREPIVIISHCHNKEKLNALQSFITQIKSMGVELISLSDAVRRYSL